MKPKKSLLALHLAFAATLLSAPASADDLFPDKNLEAAVREQVFDKRESTEPLTAEDVRNISIVHADQRDIRSLQGLEACISVAEIRLARNKIADLSPLAELARLQSLDVSRNRVEDISPLAKLPRLQYLNAEHNRIADLQPLAKLETLNSLYLADNRIEDLAPLAGLKKLWSLNVDDNRVEDLKPLAKLTWLTSIGLRRNRISDLAPLAGLRPTHFLFLEGNHITDLSPLVAMADADFQSDRRFAPYWRVYLADNPLSQVARTAQVERLRAHGGKVFLEDPHRDSDDAPVAESAAEEQDSSDADAAVRRPSNEEEGDAEEEAEADDEVDSEDDSNAEDE